MGSDNVEEEALRRLTALRVQLLQEKMLAASQQHHGQQAAMQMHLHAHAQQEQLQRVLEAKRRQLQQLDESTQHMREQLAMRQAEARPIDSDVAGASKLDAILAQTLQMQTMFMAHMAAQGMGGGMPGGGFASAQAAQPVPHGTQAPVAAQPSMPMGGGEHNFGPGEARRVDVMSPHVPSLKHRPHDAAAAVGGGHTLPEQDKDLLNQLQAIVERLNHADVDAHAMVESALERARAQDPSQDAGQSPGKKVRVGQNAEEEPEEDESLVEDGDEIAHDELITFHDIAFSWLKKAVKPVVVNIVLEADMNLEICAPFKGTFFKKGITQNDVDSRIIKLAVRCRGLVRALRHRPSLPSLSLVLSPSLTRAHAVHACAPAHAVPTAVRTDIRRLLCGMRPQA